MDNFSSHVLVRASLLLVQVSLEKSVELHEDLPPVKRQLDLFLVLGAVVEQVLDLASIDGTILGVILVHPLKIS